MQILQFFPYLKKIILISLELTYLHLTPSLHLRIGQKLSVRPSYIRLSTLVILRMWYFLLTQIIQNKFDDFQRSVAANTDNYRAVDNLAKKLVAEGHTDTVTIKEQQDILRWVHWYLSAILKSNQACGIY
jgi:hypothetical protein